METLDDDDLALVRPSAPLTASYISWHIIFVSSCIMDVAQ